MGKLLVLLNNSVCNEGFTIPGKERDRESGRETNSTCLGEWPRDFQVCWIGCPDAARKEQAESKIANWGGRTDGNRGGWNEREVSLLSSVYVSRLGVGGVSLSLD